MRPSRTRSTLGLTVVGGAVLLGLAVAPAAVTAHTDQLYTWAWSSGTGQSGFGTVSKADAELAFLNDDDIFYPYVSGMEVCDETGYAVIEGGGPVPAVLTWDHSTGQPMGDPVPFTSDAASVFGVGDIDTLPDCTLLGSVVLADETPYRSVIASINPATGFVDVLIELPGGIRETGVATNSAGQTFVFATDFDDAFVALAELDAGAIGPWTRLDTMMDLFGGGGSTDGVDFDATDRLWAVFLSEELSQVRLVSLAPGDDLAAATATDVGHLPTAQTTGPRVQSPVPLAADASPGPPAPPGPHLAATGADPLAALAVALLVVVVGVGLAAVRRTASR